MGTLGRIAVIVVLCIALAAATTLSLKAAETLKIRLRERTSHDGYVVEHYAVEGEGEEKYFTYVPAGYRVNYSTENEFGYTQEFIDAEQNTIIIMANKMVDGIGVVSNTEFVETYELTIGEISCSVGVEENGTKNYLWEIDGCRYEMDVDGVSDEDVMDMISQME